MPRSRGFDHLRREELEGARLCLPRANRSWPPGDSPRRLGEPGAHRVARVVSELQGQVRVRRPDHRLRVQPRIRAPEANSCFVTRTRPDVAAGSVFGQRTYCSSPISQEDAGEETGRYGASPATAPATTGLPN